MSETTDFRLGRIADLRYPIGANFALNCTFSGISLSGKSATLTARGPGQSVTWSKSGLTVGSSTINFNIAPTDTDDSSRAFSAFCQSGSTDYALTVYDAGGAMSMRLQGTVEWADALGDFEAGTANDISVAVTVNTGSAVTVEVTSGEAPGGSVTLDTNTATSGLSGILKAASNSLDVAVAGTDYVATNDSRLTDSRTPTSHVHGNITNAGAIGSTANLPVKTGTSGVLQAGAFGTGSGEFAQGNDSRFHTRSHAMTSTDDHTAGNWKVFHSNGSGQLVEVALGADGTYLKSNGASAAPTFATPSGGSSITGTGLAYVRTGGNDTTGTIGDPSKPYATAQAAWDDGADSFEFGEGNWTILAEFALGESGPSTVHLVGPVATLNFTWRGESPTDGGGVSTPPLTITSDGHLSIALTIEGGDAAAESSSYPGGSIGNYNLRHCYLSSLTVTPGSGVNGGSDGAIAESATAEFTQIFSGSLIGTTVTRRVVWEGDAFYPEPIVPDGNKGDITVDNGSTWSINDGVVTFEKLSTASARGKIIARKSAGSGVFEECDINDFTNVTEHYMTSSDFTDSTGAVGDVSGLACPVAANERIAIEIVGFHAGNASGSGLRIAFTGPASPAHVRYGLEHYTTTAAVRAVAPATSFGTDLVETSGTNDVLPFRVFLSLTNGANAGTVQFRAGSEINTTSITLTRGVLMRVHRLP